jgi:putative ATPase
MNFSALFLSYGKAFWFILIKYRIKMQDEKINYSFSFAKSERQWGLGMDLFEYMRSQNMESEAPLASRLRPTTLDEVVGQQHIVGKDKLLYRAIKADKLSSIIFYGPPGTGKTTLAKVIAHTTSAEFMQINATSAGKKDMEEVITAAKNNQGMYGKKTILFIDEIHRFNKGQQDYLLPYVEDGTIILIGATTENPYFEVNGALLSRSVIFELKKLSKDDIETLLLRAINDKEKGMGAYNAAIDEDALEFLADVSNGDARAALTALELGVLTTDRSEDGIIHITIDVASECIQKRVISYDKSGDNHYDTVSAFIKSMRGSDPDAAVYYLARMLYAGEDVKFIARRIMILAAEDIGNADPMALTVAVSAAQAVERIGMPEAQIILSQAVTYMASAPKSNAAVNAISKAMDVVGRTKTPPVPTHLQDAHYKSAEKLGHGLGYKYAHNYKNHYVKQQYLPDGLTNEVFYEPSENGYEATIREYYRKIHEDPDE